LIRTPQYIPGSLHSIHLHCNWVNCNWFSAGFKGRGATSYPRVFTFYSSTFQHGCPCQAGFAYSYRPCRQGGGGGGERRGERVEEREGMRKEKTNVCTYSVAVLSTKVVNCIILIEHATSIPPCHSLSHPTFPIPSKLSCNIKQVVAV